MMKIRRTVRMERDVAAADHEVTLITRVNCHLCEDAEAIVARLAGELGFGLVLLDVDADRERANEYSDRVPVILIDGKEHGYWRVEEPRLRRALDR
ncbi:MAG: glutaredoxin 2 [Pseudonocardiales bacterium]|nr:glutaredoxin 2 [Jatrophihabitantaceae bacterium]MCW2605270.1 glutaredoxin 2 [Pseudonocardiales bacterium]